MAIKIEIIDEADGNLNIAFYYPVPVSIYNPLSVDINREPAGTRLSTQEIDELKSGRIVEHVVSVEIDGHKANELAKLLEKQWHDMIDIVKKQYKQNYSYIGKAFDGSSWS